MSNELNEIWKNQIEFNKKFFESKGLELSHLSIEEQKEQTKQFVLHLIYETNEILGNFNWKMHRVQSERIILSNITEEIVDVFKYLLGICNIWGISDEEFYEEFIRKSKVVEQRFKQENKLEELKESDKVIAIDIDGVLAMYPEYFINYVNIELGTEFTNLYEMQSSLKIDIYEDMKDRYRQSGVKRYIWPMPNCDRFTTRLKHTGYDIVLLSSRPYKTYSRIFADTIEWLGDNDIQYDTILWDEEKDLKLLKMIPNVRFVIEDDASYADKISRTDCRVILIDNEYNQGYENSLVTRVNDLNEALNVIIAEDKK